MNLLSRIARHAPSIATFASFQIVVQLLGAVVGFALVRLLPKNDFAWFTIANSMQSTIAMLADFGISSGLSAIGGKVCADRQRFSQLVKTVLSLRMRLLAFGVLLITPILATMLLQNGASIQTTLFICIIVLVSVFLQVTNAVYTMCLRLHYQLRRLQTLDLVGCVLRALLVGIFALLFLNAITAVLSAVVALALQFRMLHVWAPQYIEKAAPQNPEDRKELWQIIRKQAPNDIYFCFQSQVLFWLISIFGTTSNIAEIGALGRLGMVFAVANSLLTNIALPRFSRCQDPRRLIHIYLGIMAAFVFFGIFFTSAAAIFPQQFLWILGPKYSHLSVEVVLMVLSTSVAGLNGAMWTCNYARGWIPSPVIGIPIGIATQVVLFLSLDVSQVKGVLIFNILFLVPGIFINLTMTVIQIRKLLYEARNV